tara:strand:- start:76 stop:393 length:318 start_codon:yes stop_codon:yes gene_type:complete
MEKIVAVTFDIADQQCVTYNALEWHNFIADTREQAEDPSASLEDLFDECYGDEFWFDVPSASMAIYNVAFNLASEEFIYCEDPRQVEFYMEMAEDGDCSEEVFWA